MEIKVVPIISRTGNRSKYFSYWMETFTEEHIQKLKEAIEQIRGKTLGIEIDITDVKKLSNRKNKIHERGMIFEDGQIKAFGPIVKSLATFLSMHGIRDIYILIKEDDSGKVHAIIKDLATHRAKVTANSHAHSHSH